MQRFAHQTETDEYPKMPEQVAELESVRFFGAPESRSDLCEKMTAGDLVAFHQAGEYVGVGWIGTTLMDDNEVTPTAVWDDTSTPLIFKNIAITVAAFRAFQHTHVVV